MEELRVPFPTGKDSLNAGGAKRARLGYPDRSKPCDGHPCVIHDGECMWCGHLPGAVIDRTWAEREKVVMAVAA